MGGKSEDDWKEFCIPDYILIPGTNPTEESYIPSCPVVVFINSKSGGQLGRELLITYQSILNRNQVFDLGERAPDKVLSELYGNLAVLKNRGDTLASEIDRRLRIIVAGGDGTASWLLGVVSDLKLPKPPPVATVPLGTGNNLPFSFGWGKRNPGTNEQSVQVFLDQVKTAREMKIDSWHVMMKMRAPKKGSCDPIASLELPHSMHAFHRDTSTSTANNEDYDTFRGGFWNYFSMGMDAQVSYAFHSERKLHPKKFRSQFVNQSTYLKLGFTQGWFLTSLFHPTSRNIAQLAKVKIKRRNGRWEDLHIPRRSIVCLNLPSFSGGLNPWGNPNPKKSHDRDLTPPYVDDGLIEIVGFRDAWHGLVLLTPNGHGTRLAQTNGVRFEFHRGAAQHTYMRMDGEPWKQPLPVDDGAVFVEITHSGQVTMLATPTRRSKSMYNRDILSPTVTPADVEDNDSIEEAEHEEGWEERRKFGAADTFKLPDGVNIADLS